ncbi:cholesterol oxidase [Quadrisphaera granulorum]|uniref:Cholesterol oxidase n=1 Tax=Quadrisphaera granulorum TaxID=317664 RepID=A0A316A9D6_9ACTN|nr:GMC oxidoreductase [Quadrisphaera granulorum]PWJ53610.1 cholesterol oxidase [Quadrisphaera granulorum]SZE96654.1 cholesterol oxidase [Quadrisphaera granulorum]
MPSFSRRALLASAIGTAAVGATTASAAANPLPRGAANANPFLELKYRALVPEIYATPPTVASHTPVLVIGSGFGAAVTALRLAQAGQKVSVLERGSRWPRSAWRQIFADDALPDGRAQWYRTSFTGVSGVPVFFDRFGGVLDVTEYRNISVWRGAVVGGGSIVFTGALVQPEQRFFDHVFGGTVDYTEMSRAWYPKALSMLRGSLMPADVYNSSPFGHSRIWDQQARAAGYSPQPINSIFSWDVVRQELSGRVRASAIRGESNYGNSNGAKYDLTQNYLAQAEATGRVTIHPRHVVQSIGREANGRYRVDLQVIRPDGTVVSTRSVTCDRLFLGAGSIGTSELLVRARATGALPDLNEHVGQGWGSNGDAAVTRSFAPSRGIVQAAPSASRILDERGMPVTLENWYAPGVPVNAGIIGSLGMTLDDTRGSFRYDTARDDVVLDFPGQPDTVAAIRAVNDRIVAASGVVAGLPPFVRDVNDSFTAHPLGGAVVGKATDAYGRVVGYPGLYVVDGAAIPGSTGTVNPSLTITALAERNIDAIIRAGR